MGLNTSIEWADHTLNLWWGCFKVSPGCKNCYADTLDNRYNQKERHWGLKAPRKLVRSWKKNLNDMRKSAIRNNRRETVFVMSMGDIFEDDMPLSNHDGFTWKTTNDVRQEFFSMVGDYPELIFLLLTKRPENIRYIVPQSWVSSDDSDWSGDWPLNLWAGTSIVNQQEVEQRLEPMGDLPQDTQTFISMEPLLGPVHLGRNIKWIDWCIVGGESGPKARPMNPEWATALRDESIAAGIPFHFKQWGEHDESGAKVGKHNSGNHLDGVQHLNFPPSFHKPIREKVTS